MVYVLNSDGHPLMPTANHAKVRTLLKTNKAKVVSRCPFTIKLLYSCTNYTQSVTLGIDAGSKVIGLSAVTQTQEVYSAEVVLRTDIVDLLATRSQLRKSRRSRNTRYRAPRFNNRVHSKNKGWLAPSIEHKIQTHLKVVENLHKILPITKIVVEVAAFDVQKIKNPSISGTGYQQGDQLDFWNVREYVLFRDGHECQRCHGKRKDKILNVHHIESRKTGGDTPKNLVTLCETCHTLYHQGKMKLNIKRGQSFRDAAFMGIMRWTFYNRLKAQYTNVSMTYGYITKNSRIVNNLPKEHYVDARCVSGNPSVKPLKYYFFQKKVRCHNRQIHKMSIDCRGIRKLNQCPYKVNNYRLFDKVTLNGVEGFICGRRRDGRFAIRKLNGAKLNEQVTYKKLHFIEPRKYCITERRMMLRPEVNLGVPASV